MLRPIQYFSCEIPYISYRDSYFYCHFYIISEVRYRIQPITIQIKERTESAIRNSFRKRKWYELNLGKFGGPK